MCQFPLFVTVSYTKDGTKAAPKSRSGLCLFLNWVLTNPDIRDILYIREALEGGFYTKV